MRIEHGGVVVADSVRALRVLETSHPPTLYLPPADVRLELLRPSGGRGSVCEFKGTGAYWDLVVEGAPAVERVAWSYADPWPGYEALRDHLSFYPVRVDAAWLGDERVRAQEGDFYGGWVTRDLRGPFKGGPGTRGW